MIARSVMNDPVAVKAPVAGSNSSADAAEENIWPEAISTRPSWRSVTTGLKRAVVIEPAELNVPVRGSYMSAELVTVVPE